MLKTCLGLPVAFFLCVGSNLALASQEANVSISYNYQPAQGRLVNGRMQIDHKYWACIDNVKVQFAQPVRYVSLQGKFVAGGPYRTDRGLVLDRMSSDLKTFTYKVAGTGICADYLPFEKLTLKAGVTLFSGSRINSNVVTRLRFPPPRDVLPETGATRLVEQPVQFSLQPTVAEAFEAAAPARVCPGKSGKPCLVNLSPSTRINHGKVNQAFLAMQSWNAGEKNRSLYNGNSLSLAPLDGTILVPRGPGSRARHYGRPDILSVVRQAAKFTELMLPNLREIGLADITTSRGETPHTTWPDGTRQYLHPEGAHQGDDADVGYISIGAGNDQSKDIDLEANFWMLYSVLQSSGVDIVYTAYKTQFQKYAQAAFRAGLINDVAAARFDSARLIQDENLRHDTHMHIKVANHDNGRQTLRFTPANDVYNCFLGLRPNNAGSENNFCLTK